MIARGVAIVAGCLAVMLGWGGAARAADHGVAALKCRNAASGAHWEMRVDYARGTVDSLPARISPDRISWFDPQDGGHYTFDRESGDLVTILGSSTGGWLRRNSCRLEPSR